MGGYEKIELGILLSHCDTRQRVSFNWPFLIISPIGWQAYPPRQNKNKPHHEPGYHCSVTKHSKPLEVILCRNIDVEISSIRVWWPDLSSQVLPNFPLTNMLCLYSLHISQHIHFGGSVEIICSLVSSAVFIYLFLKNWWKGDRVKILVRKHIGFFLKCILFKNQKCLASRTMAFLI